MYLSSTSKEFLEKAAGSSYQLQSTLGYTNKIVSNSELQKYLTDFQSQAINLNVPSGFVSSVNVSNMNSTSRLRK